MKIAVVGGGQLGRMLGLAGVSMGVEFRFLDPVDGAPASAVGELHVGALNDRNAITKLCDGCDVVTYEWEGVPADALAAVAETHTIAPPLRALAVSQDRVAEKSLCHELGIRTAPFLAVSSEAELGAAAEQIGLPAILKTRRGGYDGKGQYRIDSIKDLAPAWAELGPATALILEGHVAFDRELSVLACRGRDGSTVVWPVAQNRHEHGILRESRVPAVDDATQARAALIAEQILDALDYVGVLCAELFDADGELLVNELAPRVHNSGHWTIEGATTSQFENHVRAVLGLPLGDPGLIGGPSAMLNCIGRLPDPAGILAIPGAHFHDYGKSPRTGRKVGHVTLVAPDEETLEIRLAAARAAMGIAPQPSPPKPSTAAEITS